MKTNNKYVKTEIFPVDGKAKCILLPSPTQISEHKKPKIYLKQEKNNPINIKSKYIINITKKTDINTINKTNNKSSSNSNSNGNQLKSKSKNSTIVIHNFNQNISVTNKEYCTIHQINDTSNNNQIKKSISPYRLNNNKFDITRKNSSSPISQNPTSKNNNNYSSPLIKNPKKIKLKLQKPPLVKNNFELSNNSTIIVGDKDYTFREQIKETENNNSNLNKIYKKTITRDYKIQRKKYDAFRELSSAKKSPIRPLLAKQDKIYSRKNLNDISNNSSIFK
jgi:hypothetical protein